MKRKQVIVEWFATEREALKFQHEYNENPFDPLMKDVTFKDIYERYVLPDIELKSKSSQKTYKAAYKRCEPLYDKKIRDIKRNHIKTLLLQNNHLGESTIGAISVVLNMVFDFCVDEDLIVKSPSRGVVVKSTKEKEKRTSWTREEVQLVRDNLDYVIVKDATSRTSSVKAEPMMDTLLILFYTGLRIEELLDLRTADVHLDERWMQINGTKNSTSNRIVPIHKDIMPLIEKRMSGEYLVEARGNHVPYPMYRTKFFNPMCEHFGLDHKIHETRHTFSTFSALSNMNFAIRQKILGHKGKNITEDVYTHVFIKDLVNEIDKLVI